MTVESRRLIADFVLGLNRDTLQMTKEIKVDSILPYVEISGQSITTNKFVLKDDRVIIGRLSDSNHISLEPDPQKLVTRYMHCSIEKNKGVNWIIDNDSKNGTFLKRGDFTARVQGEEKLENQDVILILAKINTEGKPEYWEITYFDPLATECVTFERGGIYLEYDWIQAKLTMILSTKQYEVKGLSPQEHSLIRYFEQRNKNNGDIPVMCTYEELIIAIWDELSDLHTKNDITRLIWGLRKKIEIDPQSPQFIQNIKGMGYRFVKYSEKEQ